MTYCLEGSCSIQLSYGCILLVGAAGFEPATPCSQSRCATRLRYAPADSQVSIHSTPLVVNNHFVSPRSCNLSVRFLACKKPVMQ